MVSAPALGTRWSAYRGEGAFRDGQKIQVSKIARLSESMIFTTGTGSKKNAKDRATLRRLADAAKNSRALGGFWQHMLVAEGAIEAAVDWTSMPWDLAPLGLIVEEAGGKSTNLQGERTIYGGQFRKHQRKNPRRGSATTKVNRQAALKRLAREVVSCRLCPRLVEYRERVARRKKPRLSQLRILGKAGPRLWRSPRKIADRRPSARRAWWQSHRPRFYRRPLRRFSVRRALRSGIRQSAYFRSPRRWPASDRQLHHGYGAVRAARQQATAQRNHELPRIHGARNPHPST